LSVASTSLSGTPTTSVAPGAAVPGGAIEAAGTLAKR
jgi:hypothetical protein